ncbi:MAG: hypothetical protein B7Z68_04745 [Acidobacteria bacterium 21-70-11]|nr:MAG: hypothetical protein B7Z68_04745 [Acidobacteria bacterium 21-70-11]OYW05867.1 MAG: hypothetical protein B7Z61_04610 [Acidobacteria bacterium 37-71-11]HQT95554.1 hypothetical protein [Thermoanaerobaculaceae bacterium]HQU34217.1 hypothetical protein [Thermoanaerobaculaceae bacterium]
MWNSHDPDSPGAARTAREDLAVRRLLEAASARPEELPSLSPFFAARVTAAAARVRPAPHPLAVVALHMLPALAVLLAVLSSWAALETVRGADAQDDPAMVVLASHENGADATLAALLLTESGDSLPSGGVR